MAIPFSVGDSVFGYGRDSGGDQQDLSISQQEQALRTWCAEHGLILSHFFADEARKGSSIVGRDQLQEMMHRFRHGCPERGVIVWKYNRFARSVDNAQYFRAEIRTHGYLFHSITDHVPEGPMGRLFEAAIDFKDEQYLIDLSLDIRRGLHDLVRLYGCVPGKPPRGFKREPVQIGTRRDGTPHVAHRWQPDPELAPRIRQAFEMRAIRRPLAEIQRETRLFSAINSWRTFFANSIYVGVLEYGNQRIDDYCEPMVPLEVWQRVQQVQNGYSRRSNTTAIGPDHARRASSRFLLSGLVFCELCGSPLFGLTAVQRNGKPLDSYACGRHYRNRDCTARRIPKETLEEAVICTLRDYILRPDVFAEAMRLSNAQRTQLDAEHAVQRKDLAMELGEVRRQLTNVADGIAQNGPSATLNERLASLEAQRLELEFKLAAVAEHAQPARALSEAEFRVLAEHAIAAFPSADDEIRRTVLRGFIDRVDVARDDAAIRGTIFYFYPPGAADPKARSPAVSMVRDTPGVPRRTHSIAFEAAILFHKSRSRP